MTAGFDRFLGVDWSGAATRSAQNVYVAEAVRSAAGAHVRSLVRARDRAAVERFLAGGELEPAPGWDDGRPLPEPPGAGVRTLAGLDFAFGFPVRFEHPARGRDWSWADLAALARELDERGGEDGQASVRAALRARDDLRGQFRLGAGQGAVTAHKRATDVAVGGSSVFHLIGSSQVGTGSICGIAMLSRLRRRCPEVAVWPFAGDGAAAVARTVLVEVFPRLWLGPRLRKSELSQRAAQVTAWEGRGHTFAAEARRAASSSGDALDAAAAAIGLAELGSLPAAASLSREAREREGWVVGPDQAARRSSAVPVPSERRRASARRKRASERAISR